MQSAYHITIAGVVQGVGFRPFVYNLATRLGLTGWVLNHSGGVDIEVAGPLEVLGTFLELLRSEAPPLAHIETLDVQVITPPGYNRFEIRASENLAGRYQLISPDVATCSACLEELFDPADRRYRYPFINCTNCGPRFTIITDIPYDRPNTTMRDFQLCPDCLHEYEDPADRRFHAQPNACPLCGPHLWLTDATGQLRAASPQRADNEAVLSQVRDLLLAGHIVAIKGLGGFLLACDATNAAAVQKLRTRKRRPAKPFAVMMATLEDVRAHCKVTAEEEALLTSPQAPIVLLERLANSPIAEDVAPKHRTLGVMLPYTPLHHLILRDVGRPLVMTSGNLTEEPIAGENEEALQRLGTLADAFLFHNREIYSRYDDSVWHVVGRWPQSLRRARGYAPSPLHLPFTAQPLLATGADLKNTFCMVRDNYAFVSQHIGDMGSLETLRHFEQTLALYRRLFRLEPRYLACDLHPDYESTRLARRLAAEQALELIEVQHHQAHIASCLVENAWATDAGPVIGVALDGTGYGEDGAIWGGEWLIGDYNGFWRAARLEYLPLPGGDAAIRHPWRVALAYLDTLLGPDAYPVEKFCPGPVSLLRHQLAARINTPLTSSMGRLFDAVSALLGVCVEATYEAQAAIELEQLVPSQPILDSYPYGLDKVDGLWVVRLAPLLDALVEDLNRATPTPVCAARFHATVARMVTDLCLQLRAETGLTTVALSGGVWQNRRLVELTYPLLENAGFTVLMHRKVPCNDGGVSLGQAALAAWRVRITHQ